MEKNKSRLFHFLISLKLELISKFVFTKISHVQTPEIGQIPIYDSLSGVRYQPL